MKRRKPNKLDNLTKAQYTGEIVSQTNKLMTKKHESNAADNSLSTLKTLIVSEISHKKIMQMFIHFQITQHSRVIDDS